MGDVKENPWHCVNSQWQDQLEGLKWAAQNNSKIVHLNASYYPTQRELNPGFSGSKRKLWPLNNGIINIPKIIGKQVGRDKRKVTGKYLDVHYRWWKFKYLEFTHFKTFSCGEEKVNSLKLFWIHLRYFHFPPTFLFTFFLPYFPFLAEFFPLDFFHCSLV